MPGLGAEAQEAGCWTLRRKSLLFPPQQDSGERRKPTRTHHLPTCLPPARSLPAHVKQSVILFVARGCQVEMQMEKASRTRLFYIAGESQENMETVSLWL